MKGDKSHNEAVRQLFTETSEEYAGMFLPKKNGKNLAFRKRLALVDHATRNISGNFFDCAVGSGEITAAIIANGNFDHATLLDLSPKMLDLAATQIKAKLPGNNLCNIDFKCEDVFRFASENMEHKYNCIVCLGLIAHTGRLQELLILLRGLLEKDGIILLQSTLLDHLGTRMERLLAGDPFFKKHGYKISYFRHDDIKTACAGAGLKITERKRYSLGIPFGDRLWGWGNYQLEQIFKKWAEAHGSEAIYIIKVHGKS